MKYTYKIAVSFVALVWIILWIVFSMRESKFGQFDDVAYCYSHEKMSDKLRHLYGSDLYDFLAFVKKNLPSQGTYELKGDFSYNIEGMRTRYFLWPLKRLSQDPDFEICFHQDCPESNGYKIINKYQNVGLILARGTN